MEKLEFNIDAPAFLAELRNVTQKSMPEINIPLKVLQSLLSQVAARAIELNDPKLNILMLRMKLYDIPHDEIQLMIEGQKARIK